MKFYNFLWIALLMIALIDMDLMAHHSSGGNFTNLQPGLRYKEATHSIEIMYQRRWLDFQSNEIKTLSDFNYPSIIQQIQNGQSGNGHQHGVDDSYYREYRNDVELRANIFWHKKMSLAFSFPIRQVQLFKDGEPIDKLSGIGDPTLFLNYFPIDFTGNNQKGKTGHRLCLGVGTKIPFGKFSVRNYKDEVVPAYQPGTGSFDFVFQGSYMLLWKKWGWFNFFAYNLNTRNPNGFRFSNALSFRSNVFMKLQKNSSQWIPNIGMELQKAGADALNNEKFTEDSGGVLMLGNIGLEYFYKNYGLNIMYGIPFLQKLNGKQFQYRHQIQVGIQFLFNKKNKNNEIN